MIKRLFIPICAFILTVAASAQSVVNARFVLSNFVGTPLSVSQISLTPLWPNYNYTGAILAPTPMNRVTDASGVYTYSNLIVGYSYVLGLKIGTANYLFTNDFPAGLTNTSSGYVNAAQYTGFWVAGTQPQIFAYYVATNFMFTTSSNFVYQTNIFNVTNNFSGTNFTVSAGTNITVTQVGNNFALNVPLQVQLTNPLGSAAYSASSAYMPNPLPASVTNQFLTAAATNNGVSTAQFNFGTNSIGTNAYAQLAATNAVLVASVNALNAALTAMVNSVSNQMQNTKLTGNGILTNLAVTGAFTNGLAGGTNVYIFTNVINQVVLNVPDARFQAVTNPMGSAAYSAASAYMPNPLPASVTNKFLTADGTNSLVTQAQLTAGTNAVVGQVIALGTALTNFSYQIGLQGTNYAKQVGLDATNSIAVTSNSLISSIGASITASVGLLGTQQTNNRAFTSNSILSSAAIQSSNAIAIATGGISNYVNQLSARVVTNGDTRDIFLFSSNNFLHGNFIGNGGSVSNLNAFNITNGISSNNITGQINAGQIYGIPTTNTFIPSTNGIATSLQIADLMVFGVHTNFAISTNDIALKDAGSSYANGIYRQIASGLWSNVFNANMVIQFSGGTYSAVSNGQTLYQSTSPNGFWSFGPFGSAPNPFGFYNAPARDLVVNGVFYSTNATSQMLTNGLLQSPNYKLSGFVQGVLSNSSLSTAGSNVVIAIVAANAQNPTNGISSITASNIANIQISIATNNIAMGGVITNLNTNTLFSIGGTNAIITLVTNSFDFLSAMTNIAATAGGGGSSGGANTNLSNISTTGTNVILSIASGASGGIETNVGFGAGTSLTNANFIYVTNITVQGRLDMLGNRSTNWGIMAFTDGAFISGKDPSGGSGSVYLGVGAGGQPIDEFDNFVFSGTYPNDARTTTHYNSIPGGTNNLIGVNGVDTEGAVVAGGANNIIGSSGGTHKGWYSVIPGGYSNSIDGDSSFAAGDNAHVTNANTFMWASSDTSRYSGEDGQVVIYSSQGVAINTNKTLFPWGRSDLEVAGASQTSGGKLDVSGPNAQISINGVPVNSSPVSLQTTNVYFAGTNFIAPVFFFSSNSLPASVIVQTNGGASPVWGGLYLPATNNYAYYTNINGYQYIPFPANFGLLDPSATPFWGFSIIASNFSTVGFSGTNAYYNASVTAPFGLFGQFGGGQNPNPPYNYLRPYGWLTVTVSNFVYSNGQVSINTNSSGTNTLFVNGSIGATGPYNGNAAGLTNLQNLTFNTVSNQVGELPLKIRWVFTNGVPWYGLFITNNL